MPATPELSRGLGGKGMREVGRQFQTKQHSCSNRHIRVAGKIGIKFNGIEKAGHKQLHA